MASVVFFVENMSSPLVDNGGSSSEEEGVGWESELCEDDREDQELLSELR